MSSVAKRYATALMDLAAEQGQLEPWGAELERLVRIVASPELTHQLNSPQLSKDQRLEAMNRIGARLGLSFPVRSFALVVARHGRIRSFPAIANAYQGLVDQRLNRVRAWLTFATPASDAQVAMVVDALAQLSGKQVIPTVSADPALLGGVIAELEGRTYDASLRARLAVLERELNR